MNGTTKMLGLAAVFALVVSCGKGMNKVDKNQEEAKGEQSKRTQELVPVDVSVTEQQQGLGFALASISATAYEMALEGCASGFNNGGAMFTEASPSVQLYQNDLNCVMKLKSFTINGIRYIDSNPTGGFTTPLYASGDVATFVDDQAGTEEISVQVVTQLGSPLSNLGEAVSYSFTKIAKGLDKAVTDVSDAHAVSVAGVPAPNFFIRDAQLTDVDAITATGAGVFDFELECAETITGSTPAASCSGQAMASSGGYQMKYVLVDRDTLPADASVTIGDLDGKFSGAEQAISAQRASGSGDNGGFSINNIQGPAQIHNNPEMALIIRVIEGGKKSFTYFNVTVSAVDNQP